MEAENNLIDNIHFRRIRKSTDHMSKYYQKNPKEAKIATMFLAVGIIAGFILVSRVSTRKLFWGTESFNGGVYTWYTRILAWIIAFLWIWILIVWVPTKRIPVIETIGKNTLSIYLLHTIAYSCS